MSLRRRKTITFTRKARTIAGRANELRTIATLEALAKQAGKRVRVIKKEAAR